MLYKYESGAGQEFIFENSAEQTHIRVQSRSAGQQQGQSQGFQTGAWTQPPILFKTSDGPILQISAAQGRFYFQLSYNSVQRLESEPPLHDAEVLSLEKIDDKQNSNSSMKSMEPMKPMEMRMGNMQMSMGNAPQPSSAKRFCTQCGREAGATDRFCAACGHQLAS